MFGSSRFLYFPPPKKASLLRNLSDGRSQNKGPCIVARFTGLSCFLLSSLMVSCIVGLAPPKLLLGCFVLTAKGGRHPWPTGTVSAAALPAAYKLDAATQSTAFPFHFVDEAHRCRSPGTSAPLMIPAALPILASVLQL